MEPIAMLRATDSASTQLDHSGGERPTTMFAKGTEHTGAFCAGIGNRWAGGTNNADGTEDSRG